MKQKVKRKAKNTAPNAAQKTAKKVAEFVEKKREQTIVNIKNATGTGIFVKWLITNKISIILLFIMLFGGLYYKLQMDYLREELDRTRIIELRDDLEVEKNRTKQLERKIKELEADKEEAKKINEALRKDTESLSIKQKRKLLLQYRDRLMKKRSKR